MSMFYECANFISFPRLRTALKLFPCDLQDRGRRQLEQFVFTSANANSCVFTLVCLSQNISTVTRYLFVLAFKSAASQTEEFHLNLENQKLHRCKLYSLAFHAKLAVYLLVPSCIRIGRREILMVSSESSLNLAQC